MSQKREDRQKMDLGPKVNGNLTVIHSSNHSFNHFYQASYYVPGTAPGTGR